MTRPACDEVGRAELEQYASSVGMDLRLRAPAACALVALASAVVACGSGGNTTPAHADAAAPVRTRSAALPQAGDRSLALWMSSGGGAAQAPVGTVGFAVGGAHAPTVTSPAGGTITPGHFADTTE